MSVSQVKYRKGIKNSTLDSKPRANNGSGHQLIFQPNLLQTLSGDKTLLQPGHGNWQILLNMAASGTLLNKKKNKVNTVMSISSDIPNMNDDDIVIRQLWILEDERRARMFLAWDANLKKKWSLNKLCSVRFINYNGLLHLMSQAS